MSRSRTSKPKEPRIERAPAEPAVLVVDGADYAAKLGVYTLFFVIPRFEVVYFRLVLESWEDGAVARTIRRFEEDDRTRTLVVALVVPDFLESCVRRLARLCAEIDGVQVRSTPELHEALHEDLLDGTEDSADDDDAAEEPAAG